MVLSLSIFLRTTLALDPFHDVPLADEIALQREYLEIERERFSDRMSFSIAADADVADALVPSLILQPLIENALKHGVGTTRGRVEILLRACREGDRLCIAIENDMPRNDGDMPKTSGLGVGLKTVSYTHLAVYKRQTLREATVQALTLEGFEVSAHADALSALRAVTPDFAGVIVSDIRMPGMDGIAFFDHLRALDPEMQVIFTTAHGDVAMAVEAMKNGAADFFTCLLYTSRCV